MQKLCCVRTRQHPLPVWSHNLSLTNLLISQPILVHFWWELYHMGTTDAAINEAIHALRSSKQNFTIEDEGVVGDFMGVKIDRSDDGTVTLTQPQLIDLIIEDLNMKDNTKLRAVPACSSKLLHKDADGESIEASFHYHSVIGKLNFLEQSTHSDISVSVHQCTRFQDNPKKSHLQAVRTIGCYLIGTRDKGIVMRPDHTKSF